MDDRTRKQMYEAKQGYADKRNADNAKIETLTEEQHNVLAWLCQVRHDLHSNSEDLFYSERSNYTKFWDYIDDGCGGSVINDKLDEIGLDKIDFSEIDMIEAPSDTFCETDEDYENGLKEIHEISDKINRIIESYLSDIDKEHGTNYCPTGLSRLY